MSRIINRLSPLEVANAEVGVHADGGGLYLQVTTTVAGQPNKSWLFRYSVGGRERQMGLGSLTEVKRAHAREKAAECRQQRQNGIDPIEARERARRLAEAEWHNFSSRFRDLLCHLAQESFERKACCAVAVDNGDQCLSKHRQSAGGRN